MILTCELCQNQFLTESDPHVVIPGKEIKIYCYCQVKGNNEQKWIDQLKHEHKLYQKHLSGLNKEIERLEAENAKLNQEIEKFRIYLEAWGLQ
jgi:hypothetical protein